MSTAMIDCTDRHCIIGAGPSGLAQARAFLAAGLPFDIFERHMDVGGLWDINNPGTPVYENTHFVSSRRESGFMDFPFPPGGDFPRRDEIFAYLKAFAHAYGLRKHICFSSTVERVEPQDGFWLVTVRGETRLYRSVVCASGMHWTPNWPEIPGTFDGLQRHSIDYRSSEEFRNQRVLIVGAGNSGCDIATEAARTRPMVRPSSSLTAGTPRRGTTSPVHWPGDPTAGCTAATASSPTRASDHPARQTRSARR